MVRCVDVVQWTRQRLEEARNNQTRRSRVQNSGGVGSEAKSSQQIVLFREISRTFQCLWCRKVSETSNYPQSTPKAWIVKVCRQMSSSQFKTTPEQPQRNCSQQIIRKSIKMRKVEQRRNACRHPEYMAVNQKGGATALIFHPPREASLNPFTPCNLRKCYSLLFPFPNPLSKVMRPAFETPQYNSSSGTRLSLADSSFFGENGVKMFGAGISIGWNKPTCETTMEKLIVCSCRRIWIINVLVMFPNHFHARDRRWKSELFGVFKNKTLNGKFYGENSLRATVKSSEKLFLFSF